MTDSETISITSIDGSAGLGRRLALGLATCGVIIVSGDLAQAQAPTCQNSYSGQQVIQCQKSVDTLAPFATLLNSAEGAALLQANLQKEIEIYSTSTLEQQNLATINAQGPFVPYYVSGNIWAMVPGASAIANLAYYSQLPPNAYDLLNDVLSTTYVGQAKYQFAPQNNYGNAYGLYPTSYTNIPGDPRPFLVSGEIYNNPWSTTAAGPFPTLPASEACQQSCEWSANAPEPSFPSGHSEAGYTTGLLYAVLLPEYYQELVVAAQTFGYSRNILGVHYPLDVIGGRIIATFNLVQWLSGAYGETFSAEMAAASEELRIQLGAAASVPYAACASNVAGCMAAGVFSTAAQFTAANQAMVSYLTYDLPSVGATTEAPIVPENAHLLLQSRFPYLSNAQIDAVIATTELPSGVPLDDHKTGWARLNLYAAAGGYGAFTSDVTVTMNASAGGYNAIDMWSNNISGPGGLTKLGDGVLILGGDNTYTGGTKVGGGTLALTGSLVGDLSVSAGATFLSSGGYSVASHAKLTNEGTFQSVNATLTSHGTIDNRGTLLSSIDNRGKLTNNGTIVGDVANTGTLKGTGTLVGNLVNGGIVAPGNSIGATEVTGSVTFGSGSTYQVEVAANGASDLVVAGGPITLGGTLEFVQSEAAVQPFTSYTILTSASGISGSFATVVDPFGTAFPFLDVALTNTGSTLSAAVVPDRAAFAGFQGTTNQQAVGDALASLPLTNGVLQSASMLSAAAAPAAFDLLSGQIYASTATVLQQQSTYVRDAVGARLRQAAGSAPSGGPNTAQLAPGWAPTLWVQAYGGWGSTDATTNTAELSRSIGGLVGGIDTAVGDTWRVGLAGGYSQSNYSLDAPSSSGSATSYDLSAYAGAQWGDLAVRLGAAYAWHDLSASRTVILPNFVNALSSDYSGNTAQAFGEIAYGFAAGPTRIEPFAALSYVHLDLGGFTEAGGAAALTGASQSQDNTFSALGLRATQSVALGSGVLTARGSLAWQYAFGDVNPQATLAFASGSAPFTVSGAPIGRNAALLGVGLDYRVSSTLSLGVAYSGAFSDVGQDNAVNGRLSLAF
ncbi:MAG: autotransporter domain-containing protein [Pseudomonadota bacterium]